MNFTLTFEGQIPAKRTDLAVIWKMRSSFSRQLGKLWGKTPFDVLKTWQESTFSSGAPNFIKNIGGREFVSIYGADIGVGVGLDITLLTGIPHQKQVISAGDLDNRIKRIIDALRIPSQKGELLKSETYLESRCYCLIDDDSAVLSLTAKLGTYLGSDDPSTSFAIVNVKPIASRVTMSNISMLF